MSSVVPQTPYNEYPNVDGSTGVFPYEFQVLSAADMVVTVNDILVPSSEYVLSGVGNQAGGDVTFTTNPAAGTTVLLSRDIALERDTDYQYNGPLKERTIDNDFNRLWQVLQQLSAYLGGAVRAPFPEQLSALPKKADRAGRMLAFDPVTGDIIVVIPASGSAADLALQLVAGFLGRIKAQRFATIGPAADFPTASYHVNKTVTTHGGYGLLDSSIFDFSANTDPLVGSASLNDNSITQGSNPLVAGVIDHHYSFQSYHHVAMNPGGVLAQFAALFSQLDVQSGSVTNANLVWLNNPLGAGTIGSLVGMFIAEMTRGSSNWGIRSYTARSFLGGVMHFGDTVGTSYTTLGYNGDGYQTATPRANFAFRIAGVPGNSARLQIGAIGGASNDSILEQEASGRTRLAPRPGFGILLDGTVEVSGGLVLSLPVILANYTVGTLPSAAAWARGHAEVSDANSTTFNATAVGGGANKMGVRSNGTTWVIG